ncbi:MAG: hypothetical protein JWM78_3165 [Verrucomicrobiaceae bacterium]|nr:hypothetical protein [Verrucomicrobiaceae bacterium]
MKIKITGACKPAVLGICFSGLAHPAFAISDLTFSAGAGLEAHDNAGLVHSDEKSDTKRLINADVGYKKTDGAVIVDMGYNAEYGDYQHNVQSDETAINGRTALTWTIAPRQLDVVFSHQISQQLADRRGLDVASNREERSVLTGGVDGFLHLSAVDSLVFSPRVSDIRFQDSDDSNSRRATMTATLNHKLSRVSALDLTAGYDHVTFDESKNDYNSPNVMLSFNTALARLSYQIGLGANRIKRDSSDSKDVNGSTVRAAIDYKGDEGSDWGASYIRQLTDSSIGLSNFELSVPNFESNDSNFDQFDIIQSNKVNAYWHQRINASSQLSLSAGFEKQDYKETPRDQSIADAQAGYQYSINSRWSTGVDAQFERTKFLDDPKSKYDTTRVYFNVTYRPLRPLEIKFSIGQDKRNADTSALSYTDKVALIGFKYKFF